MSRPRKDAPAERRMSRLNWMEFAEWVPDPVATVLIPVGTLEAHGITSLGTDNEIATHLAEAVAERLNALVAPTIPYGVNVGLGALAGGTHVKSSAFVPYVAAILTTLTHQGFRNLVIVNGHGGNTDALRDAMRQVHEETGAYVASYQWWTECSPIAEDVLGAPGAHAGVDETASMLSIAPDQVFTDRWDPSLAFEVRGSLTTYPAPGSLLYYGGRRSDPVLDLKKARLYWDRVVEHTGELLEDLVLRWEREGFPAPRPRRSSLRGHAGHGGGGGNGNGHDKGGSAPRKKNS
jgi:creatinine amidohydrolase